MVKQLLYPGLCRANVTEARKTCYIWLHDVKGRENTKRTELESFPLWLQCLKCMQPGERFAKSRQRYRTLILAHVCPDPLRPRLMLNYHIENRESLNPLVATLDAWRLKVQRKPHCTLEVPSYDAIFSSSKTGMAMTLPAVPVLPALGMQLG